MVSPPTSGLGAKEAVPRANPAQDPLALALSPQEGWVFSRVDGHTSVGELCLITGLGEQQTIEILKGLAQRGLILVAGQTAPPASAPKASAPRTATPTPITRPEGSSRAAPSRPPA